MASHTPTMPGTADVQRTSIRHENRPLYAAAILLTIYALIETGDCLALVLMQLGWLPNLYPPVATAWVNDLLNNTPIFMLPLFFYFTFFRWMAAIGLLRNRHWDLWATVWVTVSTLIFTPPLMPFSSLDLLITIPIMALLLIGCAVIGAMAVTLTMSFAALTAPTSSTTISMPSAVRRPSMTASKKSSASVSSSRPSTGGRPSAISAAHNLSFRLFHHRRRPSKLCADGPRPRYGVWSQYFRLCADRCSGAEAKLETS